MKGNLQIGNEVSPQTRSVIERLLELSDTGEGNRGNPLNRYLKVGDLIDLGLAKALNRSAQRLVSGKNFVSSGGSNSAIPPKPTGLYTSDGFSHVFLGWDSPLDAYSNHAYTEIWRSTEDNRASAVSVAQVAIASLWADMSVTYGVTYFYWIRFVSDSDIPGPFNSSVGVPGQAVQDPGELLERLRDKIKATELYSDLLERINLIDADGTGLVDQVENLNTIFGTTTSSASSAAAAAQAASDAIAAKADALIAQGFAEAAQSGAETAHTAATNEATASATSASNAASYSTDASNAATASNNAKVAAEAARDGANTAATASAASASVASSEASDAGDSASAAQTSETNAASSAGSASTSATNASTSETNAAGSASSASSSATNSANSATSASNSATASAGSASSSSTSATNAGNSATSAAAAKVAAESARNTALGHASAAATSASTATTEATNAANSATSANSSSTTAATQAGNALTYANQASASAITAENAATVTAVDYTAVNARLNDFSGSGVTVEQSLTATANSIAGIAGSYQLRIDSAGAVAGFGLSIETAGGEPESNFIVNADNFALVSSSKAMLVSVQSVVGNDLIITLDTFYSIADGMQVRFSWIDNEDWVGLTLTATLIHPTQFKVPIDGRSTPLISTPRGNRKKLSSLTRSGTVGTATFQSAHGLSVGGNISISRVKHQWNGDYVVTSVSGLSVTFDVPTYFPLTAVSDVRMHIISIPFIVNSDGVTMDGAFIETATIKNTAIQNLSVSKVTGLDSSFITSTIVDGSITNAKIGNEIRSTIYNASQGWLINKDGNASFSNAYVRGDVQASSVTADAIYTNDVIQSSNFVTGVAGWKIERTGAAEFNGVVTSRANVLVSGQIVRPWDTTNPDFDAGVNSFQFAPEENNPDIKLTLDTGYDNVKNIQNEKSDGFLLRIGVSGMSYYAVLPGPESNRIGSFSIKAVLYAESDMFDSGVSGIVPGGRLKADITIPLPRNIHSSMRRMTVTKIDWALLGVN